MSVDLVPGLSILALALTLVILPITALASKFGGTGFWLFKAALTMVAVCLFIGTVLSCSSVVAGLVVHYG